MWWLLLRDEQSRRSWTVVLLATVLLSSILFTYQVEGARAKLKHSRKKLGGSQELQNAKKAAIAATSKPASSKQSPFFLLPWIVDKTHNPIIAYPMIFLYGLWIFPGFLAMAIGWIYPWYEFLKVGYTHYNPGIIMDKEFTEFATWYFKHKVYKKKYWNLDAYLYRYYQSNNDNLKNFYEEKDIPTLHDDAYADANNSSAGGYGADRLDGQHVPAVGEPAFEDVLGGILQDIVETNPSLKKFVNYMTEGDGFEELREILEGVIHDEFAAEKQRVDSQKENETYTEVDSSSSNKPRASQGQWIWPFG